MPFLQNYGIAVFLFILFKEFFSVFSGGTGKILFEKAGKVTGIKKAPLPCGILYSEAAVEYILRSSFQPVLEFIGGKRDLENLFEECPEPADTHIAAFRRLFRTCHLFAAAYHFQSRKKPEK